MRKSCLKIFLFLLAFIFTQLIVLPWLSANELLPLWADIIAMSFGLVVFTVLVDRITSRLWSNDELTD